MLNRFSILFHKALFDIFLIHAAFMAAIPDFPFKNVPDFINEFVVWSLLDNLLHIKAYNGIVGCEMELF